MNSRSVWWWIGFLGCHKGYIAYCRAKREGQRERCLSLEAKFECIADLYVDFGDIFEQNILRDKKAFGRWLAVRRRLFDDRRSVSLVVNPAAYVRQPATVLIEVPLFEKRSDVLAGVKGFLDRYYDGTIIEKAKGVKQPRLALNEVRAPKYRLSTGSNDLNAATIKALRKAAYVAGLRHRRKDDGKPLSITDTVLAIKQDPKNPLGWKLTADDKRAVERGVFKRDLFGGSEVTLVKRHRKDFDAYVRNTIYGRFPDNS
jgi:hypothetical protein